MPRSLNPHKHLNSFFIVILASCFLFLASLLSLSCSQPFQPEINYTPQLAMYSILFANRQGVYVKLYSMVNSMNSNVNLPVHGARVGLVIPAGQDNPADSSSSIGPDTLWLQETGTGFAEDTNSVYYLQTRVMSGGTYELFAQRSGYQPASAFVTVPNSYVTIPDTRTYAALRFPDSVDYDPSFVVHLVGSVAYYAELYVEYRGFNSSGTFQSGYIPASGSNASDPFIQSTAGVIQFTVSRFIYSSGVSTAKRLAGNLRESHFYADIIVNQMDDPLYRFYITSGRWTDPLAMRTDRPIFTNVNGGQGIVGGAAVDTTRIFLF